MSTPTVEFEGTAAEWRERLPEVPLAVPEEEDAFLVALPRALVTGAALAVSGGAAYTLYFVLFYSLYLLMGWSWMNKEAWDHLSDPVALLALIIFVPAMLAFRLVPLFFVASRVGAMYGRLTYLRANNTVASWIGIVVAGSGTGLMVILLVTLAHTHGLLPQAHAKNGWSDYALFVLSMALMVLMWQVLVLVTWEHHSRRHCPRCGGLLTRTRTLSLSTAMAEQIAEAAQDVAPATWPSLSEDSPDEDPDNVGCALFAYRCDNCSARLLEGTIAVERPEQKDNWTIWVWLSAVFSPGETATLEAGFPPRSLWQRLFLTH